MYTWIVVAGGIFSFVAAMGIGANDVANAYATSVGSKALTMKQAVVLASVFETSGAVLMGSHVTKTIRKGIADYECFENDPGALMYGSMCVCACVGLWLFLASRYEMPVSTTHSCVGGMIGMTMVIKGADCVIWYESKDTFPYIGGVSGIVISWIVSPLFSALISSALFGTIRFFILRSKSSFNRTTYLFPILIGGTVSLNTFFIIFKGAKGIGLDDIPINIASAWSFGIGALFVVVVCPFTGVIKNRINNKSIQENNAESWQEHKFNDETSRTNSKLCCGALVNHIDVNMNMDLNYIVENNLKTSDIHLQAEIFDENTEEYFKYLQIFTAICDSFSHGANDVANAIGPFAAIYMIHREQEVNKSNEMGNEAYWILGFGGIGITAGLVIYGYKIIQAIGLKLCKITPSRGVAIELASAIVIITGSRLEIPLSTTHCQIGATVGVAALEDPRNCTGVNSYVLLKSIVGWILTLVFVGGTTALLTAQGIYAPEIGISKCVS